MNAFRKLIANQNGAVAVEYAVMIAVMATALVAAQVTLGQAISDLMIEIGDQIASVW